MVEPRQTSMKERSAAEENPKKTRSHKRRSLGKRMRSATFAALIQRSISSSRSCHGVFWTSSMLSFCNPSLEMLSSRNSLRHALYT
ncbi:hypothetical protein QQP08_024716 [Theobroma cacao]|nr:hypothetical protein QQP08_024716 [Theobroma cacao]